jgi:hypothetical protein
MWQLWAIFFPQKNLIHVALTQFSDAEMQKFAPKKTIVVLCCWSHYKKIWFFSHKNFINGTRVDKLGGFIHYNAQYVMFIVTYIILKMGI